MKLKANRYSNHGVPVDDLIQEGLLGIRDAKERFNPVWKISFNMYASYWIKQKILQAINEQGKMIHLPMGKINLFKKINEVKDIYTLTFHREPTQEEIINELQLTEDEFIEAIKVFYPMVSIDKPSGLEENDENTTLADKLESQETTDSIQEKKDIKQSINICLNKLTKREKFVLEHSFGLNDKLELKLEEIGEKLGLTRERCRQIKNEALEKIKGELLPLISD